jgi:proteic killer suppression protein
MDTRFKNKLTYDIFCGKRLKKFPVDLFMRAQNKLKFVYAVAQVNDLAFPPGNRLETLKGNRKGQYSIRINDQWRICFYWIDGKAEDIEILDDH